jgi:hypothetical protein
MKSGRPSRPGLRSQHDLDFDSALDAMTAEELRSFVRDALDRLDDEPRSALLHSLIGRAAKGSAGWRPPGPSRRIGDEVARFADAARRVGYGEPAVVDDYLRQGSKAFLAGDHATARRVFEALLPPVSDVEIDLGQHEMVDEVLTVNAQECAAQYLASVYMTTPLRDRGKVLSEAMDAVSGFASFWAPLEQMERVTAGPLPELEAFLPRWVKRLERLAPSEGEWEADRDRWLREAVLRVEGVAGLERIARKTRKPEALWAWCDAVVKQGDWAEALRAYDDATKLAGKSHWRGDFLDGAALAARELARPDATARLETAWLRAPTVVRLLRWLDAGSPTAATLVKRASEAIKRCPTKAGRQVGLLHVLGGNVHAAARLLAKAPGLGWSSDDHPGHLLFPAFAGLLADGARATLSAELFASLQDTPRDPLAMDWGNGDEEKPKLSTPSIAEPIRKVRPAARIDSQGRKEMLEAMQAATTRRVEGILGNKRRRHYGHAAVLVACCLELAPVAGQQEEVAEWVATVRKAYSRFPAFQEECRRALASISS